MFFQFKNQFMRFNLGSVKDISPKFHLWTIAVIFPKLNFILYKFLQIIGALMRRHQKWTFLCKSLPFTHLIVSYIVCQILK